MSSGGKGRSSKGSKGGTDRSSSGGGGGGVGGGGGGVSGVGGGSTQSHQTKSDHNHNEKDKEGNTTHKIAPTAEQLRIAQMIDNTHSEKVLQEKLNQVMQVTGVSTDDAIVALHDCDYDVNGAIDSLLEGEDQGEWRESTKKKKKAPATKSKEEAESNKENRRVENNRERSGSRPRGGGGGGGGPRFRGRGGGRGAKEETGDGAGRGTGNRRGRMANGIHASRGRGARGGRGASSLSARTFQKRQQQPPGFTETIDTWGSPPEKVDNSANNLQIDNWDEEKSTTTEDWDSEWTGSLDKTTVFSPSVSVVTPSLTETNAPPEPAPNILHQGSSGLGTATLGGAMSSVVLGSSVTPSISTSNTSSGSGLPPQQQQSPLAESVSSVLSSMGSTQLASTSLSSMTVTQQPQSYTNTDVSQQPQQSYSNSAASQQQPSYSNPAPSQQQQSYTNPSASQQQSYTNPSASQQQSYTNSAASQQQSYTNSAASQQQSYTNSAASQQQSYTNSAASQQQSYTNSAASQQQQQSYTNSVASQQQSYTNSAASQQQSYTNPAASQHQQSYTSSAASQQQQSYSNPAAAPSPSAISQSQAIDLAALLQKAAPHSTLGRLAPSSMVDGSALGPSSLGVDVKSNILSGMSSSVGESLKSSILSNSGGASSVISSAGISSAAPQSYSPSSVAISNSIFSSSVSNLGSSLNSGNGVSKVLSLASQSASLAASRSTKPQRNRLSHSTKIPSKAVEMPEVAMAALDMQFTGLEFGAPDAFDFNADVKPVMGSTLVSGSSVSSRDPTSVPVSVSTKDLSGLPTSISQPQSLGPQPIPFPSQSGERKPQASLISGPQRPPSVSAPPSQSLAELTKKDSSSSGGPSLGSLVGSAPSTHSPYQSSSSGYGSKPSSFPSPPAHYAQNPSQGYSNSTSSVVSNNSYAGPSVNSNNGASTAGGGSTQPGGGYGSSFSAQVSATSGQYQNSYVSVSSHSLASMNVSKTHGGLKDTSQNYNDSSGTTSNLAGSLPSNAGPSNSASNLSVSLNPATTSSVQPSKPSVPGKPVNNMGGSIPPGVQQHSVSQQQQHQVSQQQLTQHHQSHHHLQQQQQPQQVAQQTQQTQQLMAGPSQYVSAQQAALQGALPPPFYNVQQPAMYSFEDLQVFQQRIPHLPQAPSSLPGGREGSITSPPSYSISDAKFRNDQNSSPVPSTINQQVRRGAAAGATYITAPGNAGMPPFYMMPAVPSTFSQYGAPAIIQIPSNTHTGSTTTQFPGPPKMPYAQTSNYYDSMSQTQDYKTGYGSGSQGQSKTGPSSTGVASNSGSDLSGYKNHLGKVNRTYEKQAFHTGTPPPFNLAGSGTSPMAANYTPMFIPTMPAAAQHHSPLMHHQLHQDGGSSAGQRTGAAGGQNKGGSKGGYTGSYWGN